MHTLNILKTPAGNYTFVGSVPVDLAYKRVDGQPLTDKDAHDLHYIMTPSLLKHRIVSRVFKTEEEAQAAADELGYEVHASV